MIAIRGADSVIAKALLALLPANVVWMAIPREGIYPQWLIADRFLFCPGLIRPAGIADQSDAEIAESFLVNAGRIIRACDCIIETNSEARICVIGSESGFAWSFDGAYAAAKAALHRYIETKRLRTSRQQLVGIAPGIIADAGMTKRRQDRGNLDRLREQHPKGRFLLATEVARLAFHLLYVDDGYVSGTVIRMNGGAHTR